MRPILPHKKYVDKGIDMLKYLIIALSFLVCTSSAFAKTYHLGGLYTLTYSNGLYADWGDYERISAQMAVEDINDSGMLGEDKLALLDENIIDYHCAEQGSKELGEKMFSRKDIIAVLGIDCSGPAETFANVAAKYEIPAISCGAGAEPLGDSERFPYFVRVMSPSSVFERVFFPIMKKYGFNDVAIFHTTDIWGSSAKDALLIDAAALNVNVAGIYSYDRNSSFEKVYYYLSQAKAKGIKDYFIVMPVPDTAIVFQAARALKMTKGYRFYSSEILSPNNTQAALLGAIGNFAPKASFPDTPELHDYIKRLSERVGKPVSPESSAFLWGILGYDNVRIVAEAIVLAKKDGVTDINGKTIMPYLKKAEYTGLTGKINIKEGTNNRESMDIDIINLHGFVEDQSYVSRWLYVLQNPDGVPILYEKVGNVSSEGVFTFDESKVVWPGDKD